MERIINELEAFFISDVLTCPNWGAGLVQCYGANVLAHVLIGAVLMALFLYNKWSPKWFAYCLVGIFFKEIFFDIGRGGLKVIPDSLVDILSYFLGGRFSAVIYKIRREGQQ